ncbi:phosphatase [Actinacidiphila acidipaludis]|uniref:Phosphatase n=1 Tax=Actinacidiphila acidipaludis TaxID=2873382 RepID=A0ABS7QCC1_9ACTN|nr:phosphatase [Streptomyces acidipaludis]MBY8880820.1 phosphatase [Streptomyces acidipaludis]
MPLDPAPAAPSRRDLAEHLVRTRIAGDVATSRENNLDHYRALAAGDRYYWLGLDFGDRWSDPSAVLELMVERCGVVADPAHLSGQDTIGPQLTLDALDRMADVLRKAAENRSRVLLATGHPAGMFAVHHVLAAALREAGCTVAGPAEPLYADGGEVRQLAGVFMLHRGGGLVHTHSPEPMQRVLDALERDGEPLPDLVVADHGWAGHAGSRGIETVGFADCNDPALFVGEAEGSIRVSVPLDDNVAPQLYAPLTAYLLTRARLPRPA